MSASQYEQSLRFIVDKVLPIMGGGGPNATASIQYVGGEILLYPLNELAACVDLGRAILGEKFGTVQDGVQSNLIGSERRIMELDLIFGGNIGTSVDGRGSQRTVKGSPELYRKAVARSREVLLRRRRRNPGAVFVVDATGVGNVLHEVSTAMSAGYPLFLRPVFSGGRDVDDVNLDQMASVMCEAFDQWAMNATVSIEPFHYMLSKRVNAKSGGTAFCPFMRNCAQTSLNLDPDGSLYTCFEMADSKQEILGNALEGKFDIEVWERLNARIHKIDPKCSSCKYFSSCQGGCMSEALHHTGSLYGRSDFCPVWMALFDRVDRLVDTHGSASVQAWLNAL